MEIYLLYHLYHLFKHIFDFLLKEYFIDLGQSVFRLQMALNNACQKLNNRYTAAGVTRIFFTSGPEVYVHC